MRLGSEAQILDLIDLELESGTAPLETGDHLPLLAMGRLPTQALGVVATLFAFLRSACFTVPRVIEPSAAKRATLSFVRMTRPVASARSERSRVIFWA